MNIFHACQFEQPLHLLGDADSATKKLGTDRAQKESYLFRSLLASNAPLAFGSDWPVSILRFINNYLSLHITFYRLIYLIN